jgi:hypothetical protein
MEQRYLPSSSNVAYASAGALSINRVEWSISNTFCLSKWLNALGGDGLGFDDGLFSYTAIVKQL